MLYLSHNFPKDPSPTPVYTPVHTSYTYGVTVDFYLCEGTQLYYWTTDGFPDATHRRFSNGSETLQACYLDAHTALYTKKMSNCSKSELRRNKPNA
jgi:hypothetical protein